MCVIHTAFAWILALLQFAGLTAGILPVDVKVDYGGKKYAAPVITDWLTLIADGVSGYVIVTPRDPDPAETTAARELQFYLEQISGVRLNIVDDTVMVDQREIAVGATKLYDAAPLFEEAGALGTDGFLLKTDGGRLIIAGVNPRGTLYGVYAFLEEQLGCRWYTPAVSHIPETGTVKIDASLRDLQIPSFEVRRNYAKGATSRYAAIKRINVPIWAGDPAYGGGMSYVLWDVTLDKLVPDSLFAEHPEYFAWRRDLNAHSKVHVCMSSEGAFQAAVGNAIAAIEADTRGANHIHIGQKDVSDQCECGVCLAAYEKYGSVSGPTVVFANRLARALATAGYEDMYVTFYAYNETEHPPTDPELRCDDNVIPVICGSHHACRSHPYAVCGQYRNVDFDLIARFASPAPWFANDVRRWKEIAGRAYIYEYSINFMNSQMFFPNFATMQPNARFMFDSGVTGYTYTCGDGHDAVFNELRNYLLAKVYWDVDCDVEYHMLDFLQGFYGEAAAKHIKKYIDFATAKMTAVNHAFDFDWHYQAGWFDPVSVWKVNKMWKNARCAGGTADQKYRVEREECSWRYYKANLYMDEFSLLNPLRPRENERLCDDFLAHGVVRITALAGPIPPKGDIDFVWKRPFNWR